MFLDGELVQTAWELAKEQWPPERIERVAFARVDEIAGALR